MVTRRKSTTDPYRRIVDEMRARYQAATKRIRHEQEKALSHRYELALVEINDAVISGATVVTLRNVNERIAPRLREMLIEDGFEVAQWRRNISHGGSSLLGTLGTIKVAGWAVAEEEVQDGQQDQGSP